MPTKATALECKKEDIRSNPPFILNTSEVAAYLGLSKRKIELLKRARTLAHVRIGGSVRFRRVDVDAFIEKCVIQGTAI